MDDLLEEAPCGYVSALPDGTLLRINRTFERWTGRRREELLEDGVRFQDLLAPGDRIYHETHYAPMLRLHGTVREIAVQVLCADGSRLPALVNSILVRDAHGHPQEVRTVVFEATDRRRYEEDLLRARRREQEIAERLQRSLLAGVLPEARGLEVGFAYRPGVRGLQVGGDWYDAYWIEEGRTAALVVGDVVGRGIEAAATMGQLRSATRALTRAHERPSGVLEALDAFAGRHGIGEMTTLVFATADIAARRLRFACAGHPPPLVLQPGRAPEIAWGGRSAPLGAQQRPAPREDDTIQLEPGGAVVLYTDGLVERRDRSLDDGLDALCRAAAEHGADADALLRAMQHDGADDDICLLTARLGV